MLIGLLASRPRALYALTCPTAVWIVKNYNATNVDNVHHWVVLATVIEAKNAHTSVRSKTFDTLQRILR